VRCGGTNGTNRQTVFTFIETAPGYPMPIKEWFYPGHLDGLEFIYPKKQAHALEPVLSGDAGDLHDLATFTVEAGRLKNGEVSVGICGQFPENRQHSCSRREARTVERS
jgi:hypothetical protein